MSTPNKRFKANSHKSTLGQVKLEKKDITTKLSNPFQKSSSSNSNISTVLANRSKPHTTAVENETSVESFVTPDWLPKNPLSPHLSTSDVISSLQLTYATSSPYKHIKIDNLCKYHDMLQIRKDIVRNLPTVDRETDLFKVSQTIDLNNIPINSAHAQKIPHLMALRTHMYSAEFREFLESVTGCGTLSDRVDCAANVYSCGSHLLTHDDVITTRKLSYIIYLSESPDEQECGVEKEGDCPHDWKDEYGGALELYDAVPAPILPKNASATARKLSDDNETEAKIETEVETETAAQEAVTVKIPLPVPARIIPPTFNSMVVFEVKAGESFHAVQEVYSATARRVSIQGWFHFAGPRPDNYDRGATVRLLQTPLLPPQYTVELLQHAKDQEDAQSQASSLKPDLLEKCAKLIPINETETRALVATMCAIPADEGYFNHSSSLKDLSLEEKATEEEKEYINNALMKLVKKQLVNMIETGLEKAKNINDIGKDTNDDNGDEPSISGKGADWDNPETIKADLAYLRQFINPVYTMVNTIRQLSEQFQETGVLHLSNFLRQDIVSALSRALIRADVDLGLSLLPNQDCIAKSKNAFFFATTPVCDEFQSKQYPPDIAVGTTPVHINPDTTLENAIDQGLDDDIDLVKYLVTMPENKAGAWRLTGPSFKQRFLVYEPADYITLTSDPTTTAAEIFAASNSSEKAGILLQVLKTFLFGSSAFSRLINWFTTYLPISHKTAVRRLRPGLDYTVGTYDFLLPKDEPPTLCISYSFVDAGQADFAENIWKTTSKDADADVVTVPFETYTDAKDDDIDEPAEDDDEEEEEDMYEDEDMFGFGQDEDMEGMEMDEDEELQLEGEEEGEGESVDADKSMSCAGPSCSIGSSKPTGTAPGEVYRDVVSDNNAKMTKKQTKKAMWASDDFGGFLAHVPVDQTTEGDQAEEYVEEGDANIISISAAYNSLCIIKKRPSNLSFIRYINGRAPGSRWEVSMEATCLEPEN